MSRDVISDQQQDEQWELKNEKPLHPLAVRLLRLKKVLWISAALLVLALLTIRLLPMRESQWSVLETSSEFTLYSLRPDGSDDTTTPVTKEKFGSYPVYGKVSITASEIKTELLNALRRGIEENKGEVAGCFEPRHGIDVVKGWRRISLVICFECSQIYIGEGGRSRQVLVTSTPQKVFDRVLTDAKVPLGSRPN